MTKTTKTAKASEAIVYVRVSTDEQAESGLGLEAQLAACRAWATARGYVIASVHTDEGVSGATAVDQRPGLAAAIAALSRGAVLIAAKRDRLARSVGVAAVIEETARRRGARVETPDAPDANDPFAAAMRGMMDVFAQLERAMIASRTKAALGAKKARGERVGGVPIGSTVAADGKRLEAHVAELEALQLIRELRAEGLSMRGIVARLNAEGVPCRGGQWHLTTIARLLARSEAA